MYLGLVCLLYILRFIVSDSEGGSEMMLSFHMLYNIKFKNMTLDLGTHH